MRRRYLKPTPSQGLGGDQFIKPKVQTKLTMGKSGDKYEVEADKMADKVVNKTGNGDAVQKMEGEEDLQQKSIAAGVNPLVQKMESSEEEVPAQKMEEEEPVQASEEEEPVQKVEEEEPVQAMEEEDNVQKMEEEEPVQKKSDKKNTKQPPIEHRLKHRSGGTKMDTKTQTEMDQKFGTDFSHIKIHTDSEAAQMCQELGAQAFTRGNDIYFNEGKYNPNSIEGKRLLAHELTHTIQQGTAKGKNDKKE